MNMNRFINMGLRMLVRKGTEIAADRGKAPQDMTAQERQQAKAARQTAQKARRGMRAVRRFMK